MKKIFLPILLIIVFVLSACGSSAPTATPTQSALPFPSGRFIKVGTTNYGLIFNSDGTMSVFDGDNTFVHATYKVEGNVFTETSNDGGCSTNVSFYYTFDGSKLTFNYVGDPNNDKGCSGRNSDFNNGTFILTNE